jgi:hypothetical protein
LRRFDALIGNMLMRGDLLGYLRCVVAFVPILLLPGYCLAWAVNLFEFRLRAVGERFAWGLVFSFAVMPVVSVELAKYGSLRAVGWLAGLCALGSLRIALSEYQRRSSAAGWRGAKIAAAIAVAWVMLVAFELVDVGAGNHLYLSVTVIDNSFRTAFVDAVMRTGVPPVNPLYWPGNAATMRYYYFWYVLTAVAARLAKASARQAIMASVAWAGLGLAAIIGLYCKHFLPRGGQRSSRSPRWPSVALALGLLAVTGLDVLPALVKFILRLPTDGDMEWWSPESVSSWLDSLLWVPHHIAGLICCLFGFLLVWMSKGLSVRQRLLCGLIAGVSFASAFGLSTWVALAFAMVLSAWSIWVLGWERGSRMRLPVLLAAGLIAVLVLLPYLHELRAAPSETAASANATGGSIAGNASHLLQFGVRRIIDPDGFLALPWFANRAAGHRQIVGTAAGFAVQLLLLVPGYFVELGFYGLVLAVVLLAARRNRLDEWVRTSLFLTVATLVITTFLRSTVIGNNDFGYRSVLIAQFFLLLLAVGWCEGTFGATSGRMRIAMLAMVWIGVAGTIYQAIELRVYLPVEEALGRPDQIGLAEHAMALRQASDAMVGQVPESAILQFDTGQPSDYFRFQQVLYAGRQIVSAFPGCAAEFGGSASACPAIRASVARIFEPEAGVAISAAEARAECGKLGASDLEATRWDGVWFDRRGWVWTLPAAVDTGDVRIVDCSGR